MQLTFSFDYNLVDTQQVVALIWLKRHNWTCLFRDTSRRIDNELVRSRRILDKLNRSFSQAEFMKVAFKES